MLLSHGGMLNGNNMYLPPYQSNPYPRVEQAVLGSS
jgi:hypothetical protein